MGYIDKDTMIEFRGKMLNKVDEKIEGALTPELIGQSTIILDETMEYKHISFNIGEDHNGLYLFTYAYCMIPLFIYDLQDGIEYKTSAALCSAEGEYKIKVLTYKIVGNQLTIYQKENYMPVNFVGYLFKIKLY